MVFLISQPYSFCMHIVSQLKNNSVAVIQQLFQVQMTVDEIIINATKPEFEGDYTLVVFGVTKYVKNKPDVLAQTIGEALLQTYPDAYSSFNVVKGFLNLVIHPNYWLQILQNGSFTTPSTAKVMVEYASPNTNKPLHLGHLRNIFLGSSIAEILTEQGNSVVKTCVVNDRGVHICKSMVAWQIFGKGATPQSTGKKGDHFVGDYYVKFNDAYKQQVEELVAGGMPEKEAEKEAAIMKAAQQMLVDWEAGNPEVWELWTAMNGWVYQGFDATYQQIGATFHKTYYESELYKLGNEFIDAGLEKGVFYAKEDGSVWIDLTSDGLDEKLVRRKDGTAVYITQDIGLAQTKQQEFGCDESIYVVGDEQNYHFKVLKLICQKLGIAGADGIYHLSYGMVELPTGKMKSREGTVVDADDLVASMLTIAEEKTKELGKVNDFTSAELQELYKTIGLGALKFFLLRVDPKKKMIFNPEESIEFQGFTGPFVQYTYARIKSILRKEQVQQLPPFTTEALPWLPLEKEVVKQIDQWAITLQEAATTHDPSKVAIYVFQLAQVFNSFYAAHSIANAETPEKKQFRLAISWQTADALKKGMRLLGIEMPERM